MKPITLLFLILTLGCVQKSNNPTDVKPYLVSALKKYLTSKGIDSLIKIDTLIVYRVDTLTPKIELESRISLMLNKVSYLQSNGKALNTLYELSAQKAILNASLFGKSDPITQFSKRDAEKVKADIDANMKIMNSLLSSADSLNKLLTTGGIDSTSFLGYRPTFIIKSVNKASGVLSVDSLSMRLDSKYNVLSYPDLDAIK